MPEQYCKILKVTQKVNVVLTMFSLNSNNYFSTVEECESTCPIKYIELCMLSPDKGPCDAAIPITFSTLQALNCVSSLSMAAVLGMKINFRKYLQFVQFDNFLF